MTKAAMQTRAPISEAVERPGAGFTPKTAELIESMIVRRMAGDHAGADEALGELEARVGLDEAKRAELRAAREQREREERRRAIALIPHDEAPLTDGERRALMTADLRLREADQARRVNSPKVAKARLHDARRLVMKIDAQQKSRTEARWAERILAEIASLEELIGGKAERRQMRAGKPLVVSSRDGLMELVDGRHIDGVHLAAATQYRNLYEQTDPERQLKPAPLNPTEKGGIRHGGDGWAKKRAELWNTRQRYDARIRSVVGAQGLSDFHQVIAIGRCVGALYRGGRSRDLARGRVLQALTVVTVAMGY